MLVAGLTHCLASDTSAVRKTLPVENSMGLGLFSYKVLIMLRLEVSLRTSDSDVVLLEPNKSSYANLS